MTHEENVAAVKKELAWLLLITTSLVNEKEKDVRAHGLIQIFERVAIAMTHLVGIEVNDELMSSLDEEAERLLKYAEDFSKTPEYEMLSQIVRGGKPKWMN